MADTLGGGSGESAGEVLAPEGGDDLGFEGSRQESKPATKIAPIPDSKFAKPAKPLGHQAIESVIADSKVKPSAKYDEEMVATKPGEGVTRERDEATGRFLPASGREEVKLEAAPEVEQAKEPAPKAEASIKFAGREFTSHSEAEKAFTDIEWHANQAAKSAQEWKAYAESLRAGGQAAPTPQPEQLKAEVSASTTFDVEQAQIVRELAIEAGKPELYDKWVIEENERVLNARLEAKFAEIQAPIVQQQQEQQLKSAVLNTWTSLKQYTKADGSPAFPEVGDGRIEQQIGEYWVALGLPPEAMLNPAAAMAAIGLYRLMSEGQNAPAPAPPPPAPPVPTDADGVTTGISRASVSEESAPPEIRYLNNALNRSGYRIKGNGGRMVHLFDR